MHMPVLSQLAPLIQRGQAAGVFRGDLPFTWHLAMLLALVHAASGELRAGRIGADQVEDAMVDTVRKALS
jgi:TetR/AcrR family transcriptional regulator, mexCD-oprJ operon repressor